MTKEFDIYLRERLVECDLLVYSIPYRDGITAESRLILSAVLNECLAYKAAAAQAGLKITSHIDKMIKMCQERLDVKMGLGASAVFKANSMLSPEANSIIIGTHDLSVLRRVFNEVNSGLVLTAEPLVTQVSSSIGRGYFHLLIGSDVTDTLKHSLLDLQNAAILETTIGQFNQVDHISMESPVAVDAALQSLCYQSTFDASTAIEIVALVLGTEIRHSLGRWYNCIGLDSCVTDTKAQKFISAQTFVTLLQEAAATLKKVLYPDEAPVVLHIPSLEVTMKRHRLLSEMDSDSLSAYDDMPLDDIDYVML